LNNDSTSLNEFDELLPIEQKFWKKLSNEDKELSDNQRIKQIQLIENQFKNEELNWTNIFFDNYKRKLIKINERDSKTTLKYHFQDNQEKISQEIFEIYEETLVNYIQLIFNRLLLFFFVFFRYLEIQNFVHQIVYFIHNVHIQIVNGIVNNHILKRKRFVEQVFFIILISEKMQCVKNLNIVHIRTYGSYGLMKLIVKLNI